MTFSQTTAERLRPFGTSVFAEMSQLAHEHAAINLSQGFPDFEGPPAIVDAAIASLRAGNNQYARSMGMPSLVDAIARHHAQFYGVTVDPLREITVTCGATEAIAASLLGILNPGDEVILFEPFYDSYPAMCALAGATPRFVTLRFPDFTLDLDELRACLSPKTRMLVLNTPHNPTGKVFTHEELLALSQIADEYNLIVLADEVYEHLTYDGAVHVPIATLPGMWERTLTLSSTGKTFSFTGWKVGWAIGPTHLVAAAQAAHQFLTFSGAAPLQVAMGEAFRMADDAFYLALNREYTERRDTLVAWLERAGFDVAVPRGTYFILAAFAGIASESDRAFAKRLVTEAGVAAIPPSAFYGKDRAEGARLLRFAFCKQLPTLGAAGERLLRWREER